MALVNDVVPAAGLKERVREAAAQIVANAPLALEASKQVMMRSLAFADLPAALATHYPATERMLASEDAIEGQRAFVEKRKPEWKGR